MDLKSIEKDLKWVISEVSKFCEDNYKLIDELTLYIKEGKEDDLKQGMIDLSKELLDQNSQAIQEKMKAIKLLDLIKQNKFNMAYVNYKKDFSILNK